MPQGDIAVIIERLDNFKEHFSNRLNMIEKALAGKCTDCSNMVEIRTKIYYQWWIIALMVTSFLGAIIWKIH